MSSAMERTTLHVHLLGSPNVGKSVLSALVFAQLKLNGIDCELVQERAKELHRAGRLRREDQVITTMEQIARERALEGKVDVVVTDSPPALGMAYSDEEQATVLNAAIRNLTDKWETLAVVVERDVRPDYDQNGRRENADESLALQPVIRKLADEYYGSYSLVDMNVDKARIPHIAAQIAQTAIDELKISRTIAADRAKAQESPSWTGRQALSR